MSSVARESVRGRAGVPAGPRAKSPAGLRILVPGYAQWTWRQRERGAVLLGSFAAALGMAIFGWGTATGLAVLAFAFGTHVVSVVDVIRQSAFPGFGRWAPVASAGGGLALGVYAPALVVATFVAWPVAQGGVQPWGCLVNCWAYRNSSPGQGDWVWLRSSPWGEPRVGRVVAKAGQEAHWSENQLRVDGQRRWVGSPFPPGRTPDDLVFRVPDGHVLVNPEPRATPSRLVILPEEQIAGRAWARSYPVRDRRLLRSSE